MRKNDRRHLERKQFFDCCRVMLQIELFYIFILTAPEQLHTGMLKRFKKARQLQPRSVDFRHGQHTGKPSTPRNALQVERVMPLQIKVEQIQHGKSLFRHECIVQINWILYK